MEIKIQLEAGFNTVTVVLRGDKQIAEKILDRIKKLAEEEFWKVW